MVTNENFLTEYEKNILNRRQKIVNRYNEYRGKFPDFKPLRIMSKLAEEFDLTKNGVYSILIEKGVYVPKSRKNERNSGVESRDNGTESGDNGSEDGNFRAKEFANCEL